MSRSGDEGGVPYAESGEMTQVLVVTGETGDGGASPALARSCGARNGPVVRSQEAAALCLSRPHLLSMWKLERVAASSVRGYDLLKGPMA